MNDTDRKMNRLMALVAEIRNQVQINVNIAKRDNPEGPVIDGVRQKGIVHSQEILASHVFDKLNVVDAILKEIQYEFASPAQKLNLLIDSATSERICKKCKNAPVLHQALTPFSLHHKFMCDCGRETEYVAFKTINTENHIKDLCIKWDAINIEA